MAMNRVAESYSTQNKRNEKLRWRARRDETYKNNGLNFFLKEHAYYRVRNWLPKARWARSNA